MSTTASPSRALSRRASSASASYRSQSRGVSSAPSASSSLISSSETQSRPEPLGESGGQAGLAGAGHAGDHEQLGHLSGLLIVVHHQPDDGEHDQAHDERAEPSRPVRPHQPDQQVEQEQHAHRRRQLRATARGQHARGEVGARDPAGERLPARARSGPAARPRAAAPPAWPPPRARARHGAWRAPCSCPGSSLGSQGPHPAVQQGRSRVAGLLRVELGGTQGAVLDGGDEPVSAVLGPGDQRGAGVAVGDQAPTTARRRSGRSRSAPPRRRRTAPEPEGTSTVFHPMWGTTGACSRSTTPGHSSQPSVSTPCSTPRAKSTCMPTQIPSTGRPPARRRPMARGPSTARSPAMQAANAPTPGTTSPSAASAACRSAVSSTAAPARSSARTADRRFPEP